MAATDDAADIARHSQDAINSAVERWTDAVRSSGVPGADEPTEPADPHVFLDEFFDFFETVLLNERDAAQQRLTGTASAGAAGSEHGPPAPPPAREHARTGDSGPALSDAEASDDDIIRTADVRGAHFWQVAGVPPPTAADDRVQEAAALAELAEAFTGLVRAVAADENVAAATPRRLIQVAVDCMPRVQHAAVIAVQDGEARSIAATSGLPGRVDRIRATTGQGPGLDVLETNELVVSNDLAEDPRWPAFADRTVDELGVRSIVSYRLYLGPHERAALSFYSDWPNAFDNLAITTGAIFAAYCSLAMFSRLPQRTSGS